MFIYLPEKIRKNIFTLLFCYYLLFSKVAEFSDIWQHYCKIEVEREREQIESAYRPHSNSLLRSLRRYSATSLFGKNGHQRSQSPDRHAGGGGGNSRRHSLEQSAEASAVRAGLSRGRERGGHQLLEDLEEGGESETQEADLGKWFSFLNQFCKKRFPFFQEWFSWKAYWHPLKKDKYRREFKGRRCCLGDRIHSIPCRASQQ